MHASHQHVWIMGPARPRSDGLAQQRAELAHAPVEAHREYSQFLGVFEEQLHHGQHDELHDFWHGHVCDFHASFHDGSYHAFRAALLHTTASKPVPVPSPAALQDIFSDADVLLERRGEVGGYHSLPETDAMIFPSFLG